MGFFSSRTEINTATSVVRLIEDKYLPNSVRNGLVKAIFKDQEIPHSILIEQLNGLAFKVNSYYRYGKKYYEYGLPHNGLVFQTQGKEECKKYLEELEGKPIDIHYYKFGDLNYSFLASAYVNSMPEYNNKSNSVKVSITEPTGLFTSETKIRDIRITGALVYIPKGYNEVSGSNLSDNPLPPLDSIKFIEDNESNLTSAKLKDYLDDIPKLFLEVKEVVYRPTSYKDGELIKSYYEDIYRTFPIPIKIPFNLDSTLIQVVYSIKETSETKHLVYETGTNKIKTLEDISEVKPKTNEYGEFFPIGYYRLSKTNMSYNKESNFYKTSVKLHKKLNLNYQDIIDKIHEDGEVVKDIQQSYMMLGVPINATSQSELDYLFKFFGQLYNTKKDITGMGYTFGSIDSSTHLNPLSKSNNTFAFTLSDGASFMVLQMEDIIKTIQVGSIGKINSHTGEVIKDNLAEEFLKNRVSINDLFLMSAPLGLFGVNKDILKHTIYIRKQISTHVYEEYQIVNPKLTLLYYGDYGQVANLEYHPENLLIPLDKSLLTGVTLRKREELIGRSMHLVFNSVVLTKVKWYQRGIFKVFVFVIAIALTIISQGGFAAVAAKIAAIASAGAIAILTAIIEAVILSVVIAKVGQFLMEKLGAKFLILLVVLTAAVAMYGGYTNASWAQNLGKVTTGLISGGEKQMKKDFNELQDIAEEFMFDMEKRNKELEEVRDSLEPSIRLSPFVFLGESASDYYNRTLKSGNVGVLAIQADKNYYKRALELPTFIESLDMINRSQHNNNNLLII